MKKKKGNQKLIKLSSSEVGDDYSVEETSKKEKKLSTNLVYVNFKGERRGNYKK